VVVAGIILRQWWLGERRAEARELRDVRGVRDVRDAANAVMADS
jgi:hypothetical protein